MKGFKRRLETLRSWQGCAPPGRDAACPGGHIPSLLLLGWRLNLAQPACASWDVSNPRSWVGGEAAGMGRAGRAWHAMALTALGRAHGWLRAGVNSLVRRIAG